MAKELKMENIPIPALETASEEFHFAYGSAMAEWANVERALFYWFWTLTGMKDGLARAIFYSGRSFNARAEMLDAALSAVRPFVEKDHKKIAELNFLKVGLKKAWTYSGFRNSITHGEPQLNITDAGIAYSLIQSREIKLDDEGIVVAGLLNASDNFHELKLALIDALPSHRQRSGKTLEEYLARVQSLPSQAHSKNDQTPSEHEQSLTPEMAEKQRRAERASRHLRAGGIARVNMSDPRLSEKGE